MEEVLPDELLAASFVQPRHFFSMGFKPKYLDTVMNRKGVLSYCIWADKRG